MKNIQYILLTTLTAVSGTTSILSMTPQRDTTQHASEQDINALVRKAHSMYGSDQQPDFNRYSPKDEVAVYEQIVNYITNTNNVMSNLSNDSIQRLLFLFGVPAAHKNMSIHILLLGDDATIDPFERVIKAAKQRGILSTSYNFNNEPENTLINWTRQEKISDHTVLKLIQNASTEEIATANENGKLVYHILKKAQKSPNPKNGNIVLQQLYCIISQDNPLKLPNINQDEAKQLSSCNEEGCNVLGLLVTDSNQGALDKARAILELYYQKRSSLPKICFPGDRATWHFRHMKTIKSNLRTLSDKIEEPEIKKYLFDLLNQLTPQNETLNNNTNSSQRQGSINNRNKRKHTDASPMNNKQQRRQPAAGEQQMSNAGQVNNINMPIMGAQMPFNSIEAQQLPSNNVDNTNSHNQLNAPSQQFNINNAPATTVGSPVPNTVEQMLTRFLNQPSQPTHNTINQQPAPGPMHQQPQQFNINNAPATTGKPPVPNTVQQRLTLFLNQPSQPTHNTINQQPVSGPMHQQPQQFNINNMPATPMPPMQTPDIQGSSASNAETTNPRNFAFGTTSSSSQQQQGPQQPRRNTQSFNTEASSSLTSFDIVSMRDKLREHCNMASHIPHYLKTYLDDVVDAAETDNRTCGQFIMRYLYEGIKKQHWNAQAMLLVLRQRAEERNCNLQGNQSEFQRINKALAVNPSTNESLSLYTLHENSRKRKAHRQPNLQPTTWLNVDDKKLIKTIVNGITSACENHTNSDSLNNQREDAIGALTEFFRRYNLA